MIAAVDAERSTRGVAADELLLEMPVEEAELTVMSVEVRDLMIRLGLAGTDLGIKLEYVRCVVAMVK